MVGMSQNNWFTFYIRTYSSIVRNKLFCEAEATSRAGEPEPGVFGSLEPEPEPVNG